MVEASAAQVKAAKVDATNKVKSASRSARDASLHRPSTAADLRPISGPVLSLKRNGEMPSAESISTELLNMSPNDRALAVQSLQKTYGNRYVQTIASSTRLRIKGNDQTGDRSSKLSLPPGGGQAMEPSVRSFMEFRFGQSLGEVRLHTDVEAGRLAQSLNSRAFTVGQEIFFGPGRYQPHTEQGRSLLAHELVHTRQQISAQAVQKSPEGIDLSTSSSGDSLEREAQHVAGRVAAGLPAGQASFHPAPAGGVLISLQAADAPVAQADAGALAEEIIDSLRSDPGDLSGQARRLISGANPAIRAAVLDRVRGAVQPKAFARLSVSLMAEAPGARAGKPPEGEKVLEIKASEKKAPEKKAVEPPASAAAKTSAKAPEALVPPTIKEPAKPEEAREPRAEPGRGPEKPSAAKVEAGPAETAGAAAAGEAGPGAARGDGPSPAPRRAVEGGEAAAKEEAGEEAQRGAPGPEGNPGFQATVRRTRGVAARSRSHLPARAKSAEAQAAAAGPSNEVASLAAAGQVQVMSQAKARPFDRAAFKAALMEKIAAIAPKKLGDVEEFKSSGKAQSVKKDLISKVKESKDQSQGEVKEKVEQEPDKSGIEAKKVTPLPPADAGPVPGDVGAANAAPKPAPESDVSLPFQKESQGLDSNMAREGVTEQQLEESNEPSFKSALADKRTAQEDASRRPQEYRKGEHEEISQASSEMAASAKAEVTSMHLARVQQVANVAGLQVGAKSKDEQERAVVSNRIQEMYSQTKGRVENRLKKLDDDVNAAFDAGSMAAAAAFGDLVSREMKAYKDKRYSGIKGKARWARDLFMSLPDEVNRFYEEGKKLYTSKMDSVLDGIAALVETGLNQAREIIAQGRKEVQDYVNSQPEALKAVAEEAAAGIQGKFDDLERSVEDKQGQLIDSLAKKYVESQKKIDAIINLLKEANKGLVDRAKDAMKGVVEAIKNLQRMLMNTLARAASAISYIIHHPIKFLGNLVAGVKQGLHNFMGKIGKYLLEGLMAWLFGTMAEAGIKMPESFDLKGLLGLVLQVLGLTYQNIRARAVKIVGEKVVGTLEKTAGIIYDVITKGPGVLWDWIKDKLGDLKSMILEPIKSFIKEKIIIAGITWLLGLLNPVGAFIKAVKAIYDIIMFFVEHGRQIMDLVNAIIDSVVAIAAGNISSAAEKVEKALARAIPVAIGFLAALLGIGGIGKKVKSVIEAIRAPIDRAIDWVIGKAVQLVKGAGKLLGFGKEEKAKPDGRGKPDKIAELDGRTAKLDERTVKQKQQDLDKALDEADNLLKDENLPLIDIKKGLLDIKSRYNMVSLDLITDSQSDTEDIDHVQGAINPRGKRGQRSKARRFPKALCKKKYREARKDFKNRLRDEYAEVLGLKLGTGGHVHHAIELQVLKRFPGVFTADDLNFWTNMRAIPPEGKKKKVKILANGEKIRNVHNSAIRLEWNAVYASLDKEIETHKPKLVPGTPKYNTLVRERLEAARDRIDENFGQFFRGYAEMIGDEIRIYN